MATILNTRTGQSFDAELIRDTRCYAHYRTQLETVRINRSKGHGVEGQEHLMLLDEDTYQVETSFSQDDIEFIEVTDSGNSYAVCLKDGDLQYVPISKSMFFRGNEVAFR